MFIIGKLVWAMLQPGNLLLLGLLTGILFFIVSRRRRGMALVALAALGLLLLAVAPIGSAMLLVLEERFPRPAALPARIDGILVLGGAVDPAISRAYGEAAFNSSVARVLAGIALARRHPEAKLGLIGGEGGFVPAGLPEARATMGFVVEEGIAPARLVLEERSRSTHENAVFAKALIRPAPSEVWVLVTSAYHMPRAVASFAAAGWPVIPYPVDYKVDPQTGLHANFSLLDGLATATLAGKEWAGLVGYRMMGWTRELLPAPAAPGAASRNGMGWQSGQGRAPVALRRDLVDGMREYDVAVTEPVHVVRRQDDFHPVVDIEQLGMVVHLLGDERHSRHEAPGFGEVFEMIALADRVAVLDLDPAMELVQRRLPRRADQPLDHAILHYASGVIP